MTKKLYKGITCYAIGDEMSDYNMVRGFGKFMAVANSDKNVKSVAYFVSRFNYIAGVNESITKIAKDCKII